MKVEIGKKFVMWAAVILMLVVVGNRNGPLFLHNQWKPHRWTTDICKGRGVDPHVCTQQLDLNRVGAAEVVYMDMCLEHGEFRRVK